jgi:SAM-dependent methyltransferase
MHRCARASGLPRMGTARAMWVRHLALPLHSIDGHEVTRNGFGVMMSAPDPFESQWVAAASELSDGSSALEIGCAFGRASLAALGQGCPHVICNDLDAVHLSEVERRAAMLQMPSSSLSTIVGAVPAALEAWDPPTSIRAILGANVLHFLTPSEVHRTLRRLHVLAAPGAELFVSLDSPWNAGFQSLWPLYNTRKQAGDEHPGFLRIWGPLRRALPCRLKGIPTYHPMEPEQLRRMLEHSGWHVVSARHFSGNHADNPAGVSLENGMEMSGAHAMRLL